MHSLKKKLIAATVSLLIAACALTGTSFAWYTLSTDPQIKGFSTSMAANENLEMALQSVDSTASLPAASKIGDYQNGYAWGNLVDFEAGDIAETFEEFAEDAIFRPMTYDTKTSKFRYPQYSKNGRVDTDDDGEDILKDLTVESTYGMGTLYRISEKDKDEKIVYGIFIDFWIRTNVVEYTDAEKTKTKPIPLILSDAAKRSSGATATGDGSGLTLVSKKETEDDDFLALITNMRIAIQDVTPSGIDGAEAAKNASCNVLTTAEPTFKDGTYTAELTSTAELAQLNQNQAKLIRIYIYLDGKNLKNPDAKIPLSDFKKLDLHINLQFVLKNEDLTSMDKGQ